VNVTATAGGRAAGVCTVEVAGDVDEIGAAALRHALDRAVADLPDRVEVVEVGLSGATFFCCAGVSALLAARKATREAAGGRLILIGTATPVRTVLTAQPRLGVRIPRCEVVAGCRPGSVSA
jgi:anti-anti-sigma factor